MLYFRMILLMGIALYTSRVVLNQLGVTDYGVYNVVGGVVAMVGFINGSMATATQRYLSYALGKEDEQLKNNTFSIAFIIHFGIAIIVFLLGETLGLWFIRTYLVIPTVSYGAALVVYQFSLLTAVVGIISVPFTSLVIAHENMSSYAYISILEGLLKLCATFLLMWINAEKLKLYALLIFIVSIITALMWYCLCRYKYPSCKVRFYWDRCLFCEISGFVGWQSLASLMLILRTQGVNILLNMFFGPILNAARGIAVQVNSAVVQFTMNFQMATVPQITKSYAAHDMKQMHELLLRSSKLSFLLMFVISTPILFETEPILKLWLKIVPEYGIIFVQLMLVATLIDLLSGTMVYGALATGKVRNYQIAVSSIFVFDVILVYIGFKLGLPPESIFYIDIFLYVIAMLVRLGFLKRMIGFNVKSYLKEVVGRSLIVAIATFIFCAIIKGVIVQNIFGIMITVVLSLCIAIAFALYIGFDRMERQWALGIISKFIHKIR